jgi:hypothetical protein
VHTDDSDLDHGHVADAAHVEGMDVPTE